jgi:drug/metabolite transporter (DMT)-like permease
MMRPYVVLALGVVAVSFAALLIRLAAAPPLVIATYRLCIASLVLLPIGLTRSKIEIRHLSRGDIFMSLLSGAFLAVHFGLWITSLGYTSVATSVVLVTASPIFVALASRMLFGQRLGRRALFGIGISLAGAVLIGYGDWIVGTKSLLGGVLALSAALAITGYLLIGQRLRRRMGLLSYVTLTYSSAGVLLLIAAFVAGYSLTGYSSGTYLMLVLLALVPQLIGHSSLNWSLRFVPATFVAIAVLGEPVGASLWAFLFLHEAPSVAELFGGALILAGVFMAIRNPRVSGQRREIETD